MKRWGGGFVREIQHERANDVSMNLLIERKLMRRLYNKSAGKAFTDEKENCHERAIGPSEDMPKAPFADFGFVCFTYCHGPRIGGVFFFGAQWLQMPVPRK